MQVDGRSSGELSCNVEEALSAALVQTKRPLLTARASIGEAWLSSVAKNCREVFDQLIIDWLRSVSKPYFNQHQEVFQAVIRQGAKVFRIRPTEAGSHLLKNAQSCINLEQL